MSEMQKFLFCVDNFGYLVIDANIETFKNARKQKILLSQKASNNWYSNISLNSKEKFIHLDVDQHTDKY